MIIIYLMLLSYLNLYISLSLSAKMMKDVQKEKIIQSVETLFKYNKEKVDFMKQNVPIQ